MSILAEEHETIQADPLLAGAYAACRTYALSDESGWGVLRFLVPPDVAPHVDALTAFTTYSDKLIDDPSMSPQQSLLRYAAWRDLLAAVQDGYARPGDVGWSICRALVHTSGIWRISPRSISAFLDALGADLTFNHFATNAELEQYFDDVVAPGLVWLSTVFGGTSPEALRKSRSVGAATQLADFLIDLREDLAQGRLYLPLEDLQRFDVDRGELERASRLGRTPDNIRALVLFETRRARAFYEAGAGWSLLVEPFARQATQALEAGFAGRLAQIERSGGDVFGTPIGGRFAHPTRSHSSAPQVGFGRARVVKPRRAAVRIQAKPRSSSPVPCHVGIITDGNRRWAREKGLRIRSGHDRGAGVLSVLAVHLLARGVQYVSVFGFSTENWNRPPRELNDLMDAYASFARDHLAYLHKNNVRLRFVGRPEGLPAFVVVAADAAEAYTAGNDGGTVAICLNYGGQAEIVDAVSAMLGSGIPASEVCAQDVADFLYAPDIPPLDLVIRTAGEQRLSNFMLWRAAYAELIFLSTLWPDVTADELDGVLDDYAARSRRFGR